MLLRIRSSWREGIVSRGVEGDRRRVDSPRWLIAALLAIAGTAGALRGQLLVEPVAGGKIRSGVPAQDVALSDITGMTVDPNGALVVCEWPANVIRRIRTDGLIETIAGNGTNGFSGDGGPAANAVIDYPVTPAF